jgi:HAD superfamily hydrolase (TIGR01509 family)
MIKAVIFDFFDVIRTDPYKAWLAAHGYKLEGPFLEASQEQDRGHLTVDQFLARLSQLSGEPVTRAGMEAGATLNQDVVDIIKALRPHYRLGLISNSPSRLIRDLLAQYRLEPLFHEIVISSEAGHIKPEPEIFTIALDRLGVPASETVFIDDNPRHVQGAERVGLTGLTFTSAAQLRQDLAALGPQL